MIPGSQTIRIPIANVGQRVDARQMTLVMLFVNELPQDVDVYVDAFRFEAQGGETSPAPLSK